MRIEVGSTEIKKLFAFILPAVMILSQWLSVGGINISWLLYILLFFLVFLRLDLFRQNAGLAVFSGIVVIIPFFSYTFGIADSFQYDLFFSLATGLVTLLFICSMDTEEYDAFMKGLLFSCILFAAWGCYEIFTGNYILFNNIAFFKNNWVGSHYPGVAFANTNDLVQYLVLLFPCASYLLLRKSKLAFAAMVIVIVFVVFHAESKLGMIAFACILGLAYAVNLILDNKSSNGGKLLIIGIGILIAGWIFDLNTGILSNIAANFFQIRLDADYVTGRNSIYTDLIAFSLRHPFGGFGSAYAATTTTPHNLFLYILCDYGWLPLAVFLIVLVRMAVNTVKDIRDQNARMFWCLLFASLCFFVVTSSISSSNEQRKAVWMFLAICVRNTYIAPLGNHQRIQSDYFDIVLKHTRKDAAGRSRSVKKRNV